MPFSLLATKVTVLVVLLVSTFLFSMLPLMCLSLMRRRAGSHHRRWFAALMCLLSCYAAGVFLATCLLDLFPDVQEKLSNYLDKANLLTAYPIAEFIMTCGLFLILIVEQLVLTFTGGDAHVVDDRKPLLSDEGDDNDDCSDYNRRGASWEDTNGGGTPVSFRPNRRDQCSDDYGDVRNTEHLSPGAAWSPPGDDAEEHHYTGEEHHYTGEEHHYTGEEHHYTGKGGDDQPAAYQDPSSRSAVRTLILLAALSLHSIFEGLAVGLQDTSRQVLQIFAALILHKNILAFSLGLNLSQSRLSIAATIRSNLFFSITSPLGISIGIAILDLTSADSQPALFANVVLQGLACGTFLYIVFFEILPHEFNSKDNYPSRMLKVLFLVFGYATVAGLLFIYPSVVRPLCQKGAQPVDPH